MRRSARFIIAFITICGLEAAVCYAYLYVRHRSQQVALDQNDSARGDDLPALAVETQQPNSLEEFVRDEPYFEGLGGYSRRVNTASAAAQRYFDQGLAFYSAFDGPEASRSFEAAAAADPNCPMAYWGIAIANGPSLNRPYLEVEGDQIRLAIKARANLRKHR